jgi:hypothetical protein
MLTLPKGGLRSKFRNVGNSALIDGFLWPSSSHEGANPMICGQVALACTLQASPRPFSARWREDETGGAADCIYQNLPEKRSGATVWRTVEELSPLCA